MAPKRQLKSKRRVRVPWIPGGDARQRQKQRDSGSDLRKYMVSLYATARLTARDLCTLCYHCHYAGAQGGSFSTYMKEPGVQSGQYQRLLDD
eukprot:1974669-Pyramimonas_sp.AAC.1